MRPAHWIVATALFGVTLALSSCSITPSTRTAETKARADKAGLSPKPVRLIAVGDIMMGTSFPGEEFLNPDLTPDTDLAALIGPDLFDLLRSGDVVFGNMEGTLYDGDGPSKPCANPKTCYAFRSPEFHADVLGQLGFTMMSLANNHNGDFLDAGRTATMAALQRNHIAFAGLDQKGARTASITLENGTTVGLAAFSPNKGTLSINKHRRAKRIVKNLAKKHDIVLVSFHGGAEGADYTRVPKEMEIFHGEHRGDVHAFAHLMIDAGADVVLGHGPHVTRAVEIYKQRFIAYSLGNFWTYGRFNLKGPNGIAPVLDLELAPDGKLLWATIHSVRQQSWGVPVMDPDGGALKAVTELTSADFPEASLTFLPDGTVTGADIHPSP